jgi:putative ABC transport system permease protein
MIGVALAIPAVSMLRAAAPASLPRAADIGLHWPVFALAAAAMSSLIVVSGCGPTLIGVPRRRAVAVREGGLGPAPTSRARGGSALVVVQIALAFVLLAGAALLVRSFIRVTAIDPGFRVDHLVTMRVFLGPPLYRTIESQRQFADRALEALRRAPGVIAAGLVSQPPFDRGGAGTSQRFVIEGRSYEAGAQPSLSYRIADPRYLEAAGLALKRGRWIAAGDGPDAPGVLVVNEAMARRFFPGGDPVGARITWPDSQAQGAVTIVGVVGDVATNGLERAEPPAAYAPYAQRVLPFLRWMTFVIRTEADPAQSAGAVRARVQSVDPRQPIYAVQTMDDIVSQSLAERRFSLLLMTAFAGLTVGLATLGLYGMMAQRVERRRREIGVRMSLGASGRGVFALVLRQGLSVVALGLAAGLAASFALSGLIESLVFGITPGDGVARLAVAALILAVGTIACLIPARRAARVDPILALRNE